VIWDTAQEMFESARKQGKIEIGLFKRSQRVNIENTVAQSAESDTASNPTLA